MINIIYLIWVQWYFFMPRPFNFLQEFSTDGHLCMYKVAAISFANIQYIE